MVNAESITVSLEMAKKLKEAGWEQKDCSHYWTDKEICVSEFQANVSDTKLIGLAETAAPTAEEVLRELEPSIEVGGERLYLLISDDRDWIGDESWDICYSKDRLLGGDVWVRHKQGFAGACAKMWIHLKENNLLPTQS